MSATVTVTSITSLVGFVLNSLVLVRVLSRGRQSYHILFAGYLLTCALWDFGIFLSMNRNDYVDELPTYGTIVWWPCTFMIAIRTGRNSHEGRADSLREGQVSYLPNEEYADQRCLRAARAWAPCS
jgi:hypothetical protein